ncbi:arginase [Pullulanibacillus sp. KACC 23026]|uniref:arginase n=1 Tax=Pullulanibacillus sp. KACC 23026 TaxID=3028315 RepID=UPI0023AF6BF5|nr:arginase [Pullulanibacillus sp. KACC 23026]WEG12617.1 arginase [Pullulanibacillus sp. KACC 23026]
MNRHISVIGVPMDLGQSRRGVDMGPSAMRYAGLIQRLESLGYEIEDCGDVTIGRPEKSSSIKGLKNLKAVSEANQQLAQIVEGEVNKGRFPLVLGGDHSIAIGTLAGVSKSYQNLGVIWYDAHVDLNTAETSPSGNIHGMPLAASMGLGDSSLINIGGYAPKVKPENIVIIGARSIDEGERELIKRTNIKVYTMHEIDKIGMTAVIKETVDYLKDRTDGIHLSFDLDSLDPSEAPGVGTPVIGGVTYRESHLALEMFAQANVITSAEFVEVNPILDDKNKTGTLAVDLTASLFGEKLL